MDAYKRNFWTEVSFGTKKIHLILGKIRIWTEFQTRRYLCPQHFHKLSHPRQCVLYRLRGFAVCKLL